MTEYKLDILTDEDMINILWTGGWDSTYRVVELSRKQCTVQPIYVYGDNRVSEKYEIKSMKKILKKLKQKEETQATFFPIKFIDKNKIPENPEITKAYNFIAEETQLGSQHEWLARLAYYYPGLELGTEAAPLEVSNILRTINKYGKLIKDKNGDGYILDPINSSKELLLVLGNFKFPIIDKTGLDMRKNIQLWGYEDIMRNVWVCHTPLFGNPCGLCHPCELKIETNMEFLLTKSAINRYKKRKKLLFKHIYNIERKFTMKIIKAKNKAFPSKIN